MITLSRHIGRTQRIHCGIAQCSYCRGIDGAWRRYSRTVMGARLFFGRPLNDLTNLTVDLSDVLGAEAGRLASELADTSRGEDRFAILDREIAVRVQRGRQPAAAITWAW